MHGDVSTRPQRLPDDGDFLLSVYASTRPELTGSGWPEKQQDAFIRMQFNAQTRHYRESFPDATYSVICVDGEPAGRLIVHHASDQILIVDIALLPQFRHTGIGIALIRRLLEQADAGHLPVRCHVLRDNTARRFWEHAGFNAQRSDGVYLAMERPPQVRPP
jgi:GNAT superfamily N-acetyltransferase